MKTTALLALFSCSAALFAAEPTVDTGRFDNRLTGNWNGERDKLYDEGIDVFAYYNAIVASNVSGGLQRETNYAGDIFAGVQFDLNKLLGWKSTTFTVSGINRHGSSIDPSVGSQYSVMQLVGGQTTFLYNVTLEKYFMDDTLSLKFGRMTATDDFVGSPLYGYSLNNAVDGQIRAVLFDGVMTSYPFPVWGARLKYKLDGQSDFQVGVFQISRDMFDPTKHGVDLSIRGSDGVSVFTQYDWNPIIAGKQTHFFVGMNNAFLDLPEFNTLHTTHHFARFYGHGDIEIYHAPNTKDQGLTLFATLAYTTQDEIAIIPFQTSFGANYKGLIPGRADDRTVFFVTYGAFSDAYSANQVKLGKYAVDAETVFELGHRVQLNKSSYIQPDIQLIHTPGGTGRISDAVVLGVQFGTSF